MKSLKIIGFFLLITFSQVVSGQQNNKTWEKWNYLIGEWVGEHTGQPGQGDGKFSFQTDLDGKILIRKSQTHFPATSNSVEFTHNDLLIIYPATSEGLQEAIYFDNEGHIIKYKVTFTDKSIVLTSDISQTSTRFRFTYTALDARTVNASFEMTSPQKPEEFKLYLEGKATKVK